MLALFAFLNALLLAVLYASFNRTLPEPYMDEPFHSGQTQLYCQGRWNEWDSKITTFPGLYIFGVMAAKVGDCGLPTLRAVNLLPALATPWLLRSLLAVLHPTTSEADLAWNAAVLSLLPTHFFFHFLYYTDSLATCSVLLLVLLSYQSALPASDSRAQQLGRAVAAALAIGFRQTNAVWVAFAVAAGALGELQARGVLTKHATLPAALAEVLLGRPPTLRSEEGTAPALARIVGTAARRDPVQLALLAAFAAFVVLNGGVVVGDQSNHAMAFHLAQVLYATGLASAPFHLPQLSYRLPATLRAAMAAAVAAPLAAAASLAAVLAAAHCTLSHPFLLADNRHVTFYLWRHVLGRHWLVPYMLAPLHLLLGSLLWPRVHAAQGSLLTLGLLVCTMLVLVPSPLLEPRYLTLPALLLRLHAPPLLGPTGPTGWLPPLLVFAALNAAMLALFLQRPYTWDDGSVARFMW